MAEKKLQEKVVKAATPTDDPEVVTYENLIRGKVKVVDQAGNQMYLDPAIRSGEFILRVAPK